MNVEEVRYRWGLTASSSTSEIQTKFVEMIALNTTPSETSTRSFQEVSARLKAIVDEREVLLQRAPPSPAQH